jgi:hypothetical protein
VEGREIESERESKGRRVQKRGRDRKSGERKKREREIMRSPTESEERRRRG